MVQVFDIRCFPTDFNYFLKYLIQSMPALQINIIRIIDRKLTFDKIVYLS